MHTNTHTLTDIYIYFESACGVMLLSQEIDMVI